MIGKMIAETKKIHEKKESIKIGQKLVEKKEKIHTDEDLKAVDEQKTDENTKRMDGKDGNKDEDDENKSVDRSNDEYTKILLMKTHKI